MATATSTLTPTPTPTSSPTLTPTAASDDIVLTGLVYDGFAGRTAGIPGAQVFALMCVLRSFGTTANSDGDYSLIVRQALACDRINIAAWADGYMPSIATFAVADLHAQPQVDLALQPLATPRPTVTPTVTASPTATPTRRVLLFLPMIYR